MRTVTTYPPIKGVSMNNHQFATAAEVSSAFIPSISSPQKKWIVENKIQVLDPAPWLNKYNVGKEFHFRSGYSCHSFKVDIPTAGYRYRGYDHLNRIVLNFRTIDNAKITHIILYNSQSICWKQYKGCLQGDYARSIGSENCWDFDPAIKISNNLSLVLFVDFDGPVKYVPEFVFLAARVLVSKCKSISEHVDY
jgi:hypothetical protein